VLIVDDHCDTAESYAILIASWGHEVRSARNGPDALKLASAWTPDVVFLDLAMPGMDGFELARHLRQDLGLTQVTLVAISGYAAPEHRRRSEEAGIEHHLVKPVDPAFLKQLLDTLCAEHAAA
jgi:CheY-like chemotaxis protein